MDSTIVASVAYLISAFILYWIIRLAVRGALLDVDRRRERRQRRAG